jgi:hypothetical protein
MQYTHTFKIETPLDHDLLDYVNHLLINSRVNITDIRPSEYLFSRLNSSKKKLFNLLYKINDYECPVCYIPINSNNELKTHCNHIFCKDCVKKLFATSEKCPFCRSKLTTLDSFYLEPKYWSILLVFSYNLFSLDFVYYYNFILLLQFAFAGYGKLVFPYTSFWRIY